MSITRNRLRAVAMAVPILAALCLVPTASAEAAPVSATGQFQSFGGGAGLCLDVQGAGTTPGTPLDSGQCNGTAAQNFTVAKGVLVGFLLHAGVGSNLCVSVPFGAYNGSPVELEPCGSPNEDQVWEFLNGNFYYEGSWCLDVHYGSTAQDTPVDIASCNHTNAQLWWPANFTVTVYSAINGNDDLCLDAYADAIGRVDSTSCNWTDAQAWWFSPGQTIGNVGGTLVAGYPSSSSLGSVSTAYGAYGGWPGEYWHMQYAPSGTGVRFVNGLNGPYGPECLDVQGASPAPNTTVDIWQCNGTVAQTWVIGLSAL